MLKIYAEGDNLQLFGKGFVYDSEGNPQQSIH